MTETIYAALVAAQSELTNPSKDGTANYGRYTTLAGVLDHVRPVLARHGLFVAQYVTNDDTHVRVSTSLGHAGGESIDCGDVTWPMPDKVQLFGGLITYLRRYALTAALGLSGADEDDDGQQANVEAQRVDVGHLRGPAARAKARDVSKPCSDKQVGLIKRLMAAHNLHEFELPDRVGITTPADGLQALTSREASDLIDALSALPTDKPIIRWKQTDDTPPPDDPWIITDPETGEQVTAR